MKTRSFFVSSALGFLLFGVALPSRAQVPIAPAEPLQAAERTDFSSAFTSVSEFKDVKPEDEFFASLQNLTERFGAVVAYEDKNFHPEIALSRGQFALFLDVGLGRLAELAAAVDEKKTFDVKTIIRPFSANGVKLDSVKDIKDISAESPYFDALQSLTERYGINFVDKDGKFRPGKAMTQKEVQDWLRGTIMIGVDTSKYSDFRIVRRGEFVQPFADALDYANQQVANAVENG